MWLVIPSFYASPVVYTLFFLLFSRFLSFGKWLGVEYFCEVCIPGILCYWVGFCDLIDIFSSTYLSLFKFFSSLNTQQSIFLYVVTTAYYVGGPRGRVNILFSLTYGYLTCSIPKMPLLKPLEGQGISLALVYEKRLLTVTFNSRDKRPGLHRFYGPHCRS